MALTRSLPDYMLPRWFWRVNDLPLNANGKIDRPTLAEMAAAKVAQDNSPVPSSPSTGVAGADR